jgi:hypothetical protein
MFPEWRIIPMYDLFSLCADDVAGMADRTAVETMTVARQAVCRAEAVGVRAIARLSRIRGHSWWVADEIALELGVSRRAAGDLVATAQALTDRLPTLLAVMEDGRIDLRTATKVCEVTAPLSDEQARQVDLRIAERIKGKDAEKVRRIAREAVHAIDPDGYTRRARKRREDRTVELVHADEGMASLWAYLPAEVASAIYVRVDGIARTLKTRDEPRTLDQLGPMSWLSCCWGNTRACPVCSPRSMSTSPSTRRWASPTPAATSRDMGRSRVGSPARSWPIRTVCGAKSPATPFPAPCSTSAAPATGRPPPWTSSSASATANAAHRATGRPPPTATPTTTTTSGAVRTATPPQTTSTALCRRHHALKDIPGWHFHLDHETAELTITTPTGRRHTTRPDPVLTPSKKPTSPQRTTNPTTPRNHPTDQDRSPKAASTQD